MGSTQSSSRRNSRIPGRKFLRHTNSAPGSARLPRRESSVTCRSQEVRPDPHKTASLRYRRYSAFPDPSRFTPVMPSPHSARSPRMLPMTPQPTPRPNLTDTPWPQKTPLLRRDTFGRPTVHIPQEAVAAGGAKRHSEY